MSEAPTTLTTGEASARTGMSTAIVSRLLDDGEIRGYQPPNGHRRIYLDSLVEFCDKNGITLTEESSA